MTALDANDTRCVLGAPCDVTITGLGFQETNAVGIIDAEDHKSRKRSGMGCSFWI